jgi:hypothetical protein
VMLCLPLGLFLVLETQQPCLLHGPVGHVSYLVGDLERIVSVGAAAGYYAFCPQSLLLAEDGPRVQVPLRVHFSVQRGALVRLETSQTVVLAELGHLAADGPPHPNRVDPVQ